MLAVTTIADEILELKKQRKAILLAHHYQEAEIQELADVIGDSLELARKARDFEGEGSGGMWSRKPAKTVLEALWDRGDLAISGRRNAGT